VIAGPLATQILGDLGADVAKVERPHEGDDVRRTGPPWAARAAPGAGPVSTYFLSVNRNKRSLAIDFAAPAGAQLIRRLALEADVLVENFRPGSLDRYGLGAAALRAANPRLIYCSVSGFGQAGPYASRSGYDYLAQAMSGVMGVNGPAEGEPTRLGIPIADICAGHYAAMGVLAALNYRTTTGLGQVVDISLFESQIAVLLNAFSGWFNGGVELGRTGNEHPSAAPYGVFEVDDGQILIATFSDREFVRLAGALRHPEWNADPRFATNGARVANREALRVAMESALRGGSRADWIARLAEATVSCGPINGVNDLSADPQVSFRGGIIEMQHPVTGTTKSAASPLRLSETPPSYRSPPPEIGEHTNEVLQEWLGLDQAAIETFKEEGAFG
jgi:crotonobetainyl-CoA:carnitine CoA-transferase CaiB-like acyl-CoA transferase